MDKQWAPSLFILILCTSVHYWDKILFLCKHNSNCCFKRYLLWWTKCSKSNVDIPVTRRFLTNETLYPGPTNSKSTPDIVVPSDTNCTATARGIDGPSAKSNFARNVPWPPPSLCSERSPSFHIARLLSLDLQKERSNYTQQECIPVGCSGRLGGGGGFCLGGTCTPAPPCEQNHRQV